MRSKKALYNIFTNIFLQLIVIIYGFIVPKIIITKYGSNVNGLVSSITQFLAYISLLESGFGPVVRSVLYKPLAKKDNKEISNILLASERFFRKLAIIFIFYIGILLFIYPLFINTGFDVLFTISLILIISINTFAEYFFGMTYSLFLKADQKTYVISIIQIITYIFNIVIIIIISKFNVSIQTLKLVGVLIFTLRPLIQNVYVKKKYNINLKSADKNYKLKNKWDGLSQHIAATIHTNTDITVLTFFSTLAEVSVYSVYYMVIRGIKQLIQAFTNGVDASWGDMIAKNEDKVLNEKFNMYEVIYLMISTFMYVCTLLLIVPFVKVYTLNVSDANYIRYAFAYLMVIGELIWSIRLPYNSLTLAAGHFKETRNGAWVEAIVNIVVSIILVKKFGLIGVAIGTLVAMIIRTIEFIYHTNKCILKRNIMQTLKKIILVLIEVILITLIVKFLPKIKMISYLSWLIYSVMVCVISFIVILILNLVIYKEEIIKFISIIKINIQNRKK